PAGRRRARSRSCQPYRHLSCSNRSSRCDRAKMYVACGDRYHAAIVLANDEATLVIDRLENTAHDAAFNLYRNLGTEAGGPLQPTLANGRKAPARIPYTLVFHPGVGEREKQRFGITFCTERRQRCRRIG